MSRRTEPVLEVVRSDAGYFARVRGGNLRKVWQSEVYTRKAAALNAFRVMGDLFAIDGRASINDIGNQLNVPTSDTPGTGMTSWLSIPIRHVDERGGSDA